MLKNAIEKIKKHNKEILIGTGIFVPISIFLFYFVDFECMRKIDGITFSYGLDGLFYTENLLLATIILVYSILIALSFRKVFSETEKEKNKTIAFFIFLILGLIIIFYWYLGFILMIFSGFVWLVFLCSAVIILPPFCLLVWGEILAYKAILSGQITKKAIAVWVIDAIISGFTLYLFSIIVFESCQT